MTSSQASASAADLELAAAHERDVKEMRRTLVESWPARWRRMIDDWRSESDASVDGAWLMHAANYLFRTAGVRWAVDPFQLQTRLPEAPAVDVKELASLQFVLLTHNHEDHVDASLWQALADRDITWVVPPFMAEKFKKVTGIQDTDARLIVAQPGQVIHLHGLEILPMTGLHWEIRPDLPAGRLGIDALAYQVKWKPAGAEASRTLLLPGDTRDYRASQLVGHGVSDVLFAHVWLGRVAAAMKQPPALEAMTQFILDLQPRERVVFAHLYETSRKPVDCWSLRHAQLLGERIRAHRPDLQLAAPMLGDRIEL